MKQPKPTQPDAAYQAQSYESEAGLETMRRQAQLAKDRFMCCGEPRDAGHHDACSKRPKDNPIHPDQATLC